LGNIRYEIGETIIGKGQIIGIIHNLKKLEKINLYIEKFNNNNDLEKQMTIINRIKGNPNFFDVNGQGTTEMVNYLNGICIKIDQFLINKVS
jgi:hypothetical protein